MNILSKSSINETLRNISHLYILYYNWHLKVRSISTISHIIDVQSYYLLYIFQLFYLWLLFLCPHHWSSFHSYGWSFFDPAHHCLWYHPPVHLPEIAAVPRTTELHPLTNKLNPLPSVLTSQKMQIIHPVKIKW